MKILLSILSLAVLTGCATAPQGQRNYAHRMPPPADPSQWHTVSVTPVAPGTGERLAATSGQGAREAGSPVLYRSETEVSAQPVYVAPPMYAQQPVYAPQPVYAVPGPYYSPYYYPPVSIGFDFMFGRSWGGYHHGRNWAGVGIGTGWHR